jgi:ZIP family zinc transporter
MSTALLYGFLASSGLLIGMLIGLVTSPPRRLVASIVAFGSGILVSTLTFDLMDEAFESGSTTYVVTGSLAGALLYVAINAILDYLAAQSPKREGREPQDVVPGAASVPETSAEHAASSTALLVGALLDGIPENAALGISLYAEGQTLGFVLLAAIFLRHGSCCCLCRGLSQRAPLSMKSPRREQSVTLWANARPPVVPKDGQV